MTDGPILIAYGRAAVLHERLAPQFPQREFIVADTDAAILDALARDPVAALTIKTPEFGMEQYGRIVQHPSLQWVFVGGSGYEHIGPWNPEQVTLTNCVGVLAPFLADTCMGAILAMNQRLLDYREDQRAHRWEPKTFTPLAGQTLLIVGAGAIGSRLADRARASGLRTIGIRRSGKPTPGFDAMHGPDDLPALLAEADIVSSHLRLTEETRGLFNAETFAAMKPGALFLNTARGGCVVEADLIGALESGHLRAAYLDVFETEPLPPDSPLWDAPNLLISPHASDSTADWDMRFCDLFADNLRLWERGQPLINVVAS